jgi:hypothetical protein
MSFTIWTQTKSTAINSYQIPEAVKENARVGLELRKKFGRGGTSVGENTARTLAAGGTIGITKVRHIAKYFPRHAGDNLDDKKSNGWIAWQLWGGHAGRSWAETIVARAEKETQKSLQSFQTKAMIDGDGDGRCEEAETEGGIPCIPGMPARTVDRLWGRTEAQRFQKRRDAIKRARIRRQTQPEPKMTVQELFEAAEQGQTDKLEEELKKIFEITDLGRTRAKTEAEWIHAVGPGMPINEYNPLNSNGETEWADNGIQIAGKIYDQNGNPIGAFDRTIEISETGKAIIHHEELAIDDGHKGQGIGGDFIADTQHQYTKIGIQEIQIIAGLEDGPYNWAVAGFDWADEYNRNKFLNYIQQAIDEYKQTKNTELFNTNEEAATIQALIRQAQQERFNAPQRLTPYAFTLFTGARKALTRKTKQQEDRRDWEGTKKLTT